jgi:cell wall-associated NlpC family hydrolase
VLEAAPPHSKISPLLPRKSRIYIFRAKDTIGAKLAADYARAMYIGVPYGFCAIAMAVLDWFLAGQYVFRRLTRNSLVCSTLVARAYANGAGIKFGVDPHSATPDDLWDYMKANPKQWTLVETIEP